MSLKHLIYPRMKTIEVEKLLFLRSNKSIKQTDSNQIWNYFYFFLSLRFLCTNLLTLPEGSGNK